MSTAPRPVSTALTVTGFSKSYRLGLLGRKRRVALEGLTLDVHRGEVFGYLGPNGSGKTTTLKLLMGLVAPDSGEATILGCPHGEGAWRQRVGYLPENPYLYDYLTPSEYLDYVGRLFGLTPAQRRDRTLRLLDLLGLSQARDLPMRRFSKGMTQRAGLAQALMNDPELVFLDEPMSGLDPLGRRLVRDVILDLKEQGKTVFFSTHILADAESLCDRVAVLRSGRVAAAGRLDEILNMDSSHLEVLASGVTADAMREIPGDIRIRGIGERIRIELEQEVLISVLERVRAKGGRVLSVQVTRQSLEDYFVKEMGYSADGKWTSGD